MICSMEAAFKSVEESLIHVEKRAISDEDVNHSSGVSGSDKDKECERPRIDSPSNGLNRMFSRLTTVVIFSAFRLGGCRLAFSEATLRYRRSSRLTDSLCAPVLGSPTLRGG